MPSSFQQCLEPVNTLITKSYSEARPFRRLSNLLFRSQKFWKYLGYDTHLFLKKFSKFNAHFRNERENPEHVFCF